jgi:hypothetical protein
MNNGDSNDGPSGSIEDATGGGGNNDTTDAPAPMAQKPGHLRVVELQPQIDQKRRNCVLKLRELLAQAEQGKFQDLVVITSTSPTEHSLHWTPLAGQEMRFIGALEMMKRILGDSVRFTKH